MARRVLALVVLGLALIVFVALAASESLTNHTGRTATAVTVTFSEQVRITSYDETVFPTKDPSSRSDTFRFSGGQLENGAGFSISWTTSTAEITNTEWETTGAASSASTGSSAPLTYEEIMAQIAHYPGPDEPLCVSAEGEQIWLTDLEGHADIYDNDSIKINYAPGFDKSQITRIDVYRNGVKLRFVPALFDVLTNEQMKTFDGNPDEHSPKSSHTDHAIMGYDYKVALYDRSNQLKAAQTTLIKSTLRYRPEYLFASIGNQWNSMYEMPIYWHGQEFNDELVRQYLAQIKADGYNGIQLQVFLYADGISAPQVFPVYSEDLQRDTTLTTIWTVTPHAADLANMLSLIEAEGLQADVRIQLDPTDKATAAHPNEAVYDQTISPGSNPQKWFEAYFQVILPFVQIAEQCHADYFGVMVENDLLMQSAEQMRWLLGAVKATFSGAVYSDEGTCNIITRDVLPNVTFSRFWDYDDTWIAGSNWSTRLETSSDQHLSVITANMVEMWRSAAADYEADFPEHRMMWNEFGSWGSDGILSLGSKPWPSPETAVRDDQEMADLYAAGLAAAAYLGYEGVCIWYFNITNTDPQPLYSGIDEITARKVIKAIISP